MFEIHAGGSLVDVLSTVPLGSDELFYEVLFTDSKLQHSLFKRLFLFQTDTENAHIHSMILCVALSKVPGKPVLGGLSGSLNMPVDHRSRPFGFSDMSACTFDFESFVQIGR